MLTATELRQNLFRLLDGAAKGQDVEVVHKGTRLRITAVNRGSRLARLMYQGEADEMPSGWDQAAQAEWEAEWKDFFAE